MAEPTTALQPTQLLARPQLDPQALIEKALDTGAGIETMERLVALAKEVREVQAREAWYEAMAQFQKACPVIKKSSTAKIQTSRASYSYRYAPLEEVVNTIAPVMGRLGLSISWRSRVEQDKVIVSCRVSHTLGHHEESGEIAMPIDTRDPSVGATPPQRVGIAATYAKRYSLLGIIGMAPEGDDDAASAGNGKPEAAETGGGQTAHGQDLESVITEPQIKRFSAIASGSKWTDDQIHELLSGYGYNSRKEIRVKDYEKLVEKVKVGPGK
jgi:hypothetical protein